MKKSIMIITLVVAVIFHVTAQVKVSFKVGASPGSDARSASLLVNRNNPAEEFQFNMVGAEAQLYGSALIHIPLGTPFFLESGLTYTKGTSNYEANYFRPVELISEDHTMQESKTMLLVPANIGARIGNVEITSGLSLLKSLNVKSDLTQMNGFTHESNTTHLGWQMGARYDLQVCMLGVEYQGTLNRIGEGMFVNGQSLALMNVPGRWVFSIQYRI